MKPAIIILSIAILAMLAWNFIPAVRDRLRGWSVAAETALGGALYVSGILADGLREAQAAGLLPDKWQAWWPYFLMAYMLYARWKTSTPLGRK